MMIIFFDHKSVIHRHAVFKNHCDWGILCFNLGNFVTTHIEKGYELIWYWILHHDNALLHVDTSLQQYLSKCNIKIMPHCRYSPDFRRRKFNTHSEVI